MSRSGSLQSYLNWQDSLSLATDTSIPMTPYQQHSLGQQFTSQCSNPRVAASRFVGNIRPDLSRRQCTYCSFVAATTASLRDHIRTHTGEKPFACPHCGLVSNVKSNMRRHIKKVHPLQDSNRMVIRSS